MFRNQSFQVKLVKDNDTNASSSPVDYSRVATVVTKKVVTVIVAYVAADTVRRVIVYAVSAKL